MLQHERSMFHVQLITQNKNIKPNDFDPKIRAHTVMQYEQPSSTIQKMLENVRRYKLTKFIQDKDVTIKNADYPEFGLHYRFPRGLSDYAEENYEKIEQNIRPKYRLADLQFALFEYHWYMPILLSLFNQKTICKLLTAVLLERNIVFVDDNITFVSTIILGLKTLIRPFNWCGSLVPIMPTGL